MNEEESIGVLTRAYTLFGKIRLTFKLPVCINSNEHPQATGVVVTPPRSEILEGEAHPYFSFAAVEDGDGCLWHVECGNVAVVEFLQ